MQTNSEVIHNISYVREGGSYSLWEHPHYRAVLRLPKYYKPALHLDAVLRDYFKWTDEVKEARLTVLAVIGDAICPTLDQLCRYMSQLISSSQTRSHVEYLTGHGYVQYYNNYIKGYNDEEGNPIKIHASAPITLGPAGHMLLSHLKSNNDYIAPETWSRQNASNGIQRFVALNEIRCRFVEQRIAKQWEWYPSFNTERQIKQPVALMRVGKLTEEEDSRAWMIFERVQLNVNFIGYIRDRLHMYRNYVENQGFIPLLGTPDDGEKIVVISCPTVKSAQILQEEIGLQKYPFNVWVLIDEWFDMSLDPDLITQAFAQSIKEPEGYQLKRFSVNF